MLSVWMLEHGHVKKVFLCFKVFCIHQLLIVPLLSAAMNPSFFPSGGLVCLSWYFISVAMSPLSRHTGRSTLMRIYSVSCIIRSAPHTWFPVMSNAPSCSSVELSRSGVPSLWGDTLPAMTESMHGLFFSGREFGGEGGRMYRVLTLSTTQH